MRPSVRQIKDDCTTKEQKKSNERNTQKWTYEIKY